MKKIAAIDIGTNTVLYSLFAVAGRSRLREIHFERHAPRIGSRLAGAKRPRLTEETYRELYRILSRHVRHAKRNGAAEILLAATNPLRKAQNGREIARRLAAELGYPVTILTPSQEAFLSFLGATGGIHHKQITVVIDLGGGSTEVAAYRGGKQLAFVSLPEGAVSLTERLGTSRRVCPDDFQHFDAILARYDKTAAGVIPYLSENVLLVGGTSSALAYIKDIRFIHRPRGVMLTDHDLERFTCLLADSSLTERRRLLALDPKRAEIIFAGAFWLRHLFKVLNIKRAYATARGLRHGLALAFLQDKVFSP